jgi:hypothetical protein
VPLTQNIAIVSLTSDVSMRSLLQVTAAIQKQVTRDLMPIWGYPGNVDAFADLRDVPSDYHPVVLFRDAEELASQIVSAIGDEPAARVIDAFERDSLSGIHLNSFTRQPFALVAAEDAWTVVLSHEILEMLVDPWGNQMIAARHPTNPNRRVKYLVEVCDPCQGIWYAVNGVPLADFYTPRYFDPVNLDGVRYSFTGAVTAPREVLAGGYVTFLDPRDSVLYQKHAGPGEPVALLGPPELAQSSLPLRMLVDGNPRTPRVELSTLRAAEAALGTDEPLVSVSEAAAGSALSTAEALYSLAMGIA